MHRTRDEDGCPIEWEQTFDKYGFGDGDDTIYTPDVAAYLEDRGYVTEWGGGCHNDYFDSIQDEDGCELVELPGIRAGHDDPRDYLPAALVAALDANFKGIHPATVCHEADGSVSVTPGVTR